MDSTSTLRYNVEPFMQSVS